MKASGIKIILIMLMALSLDAKKKSDGDWCLLFEVESWVLKTNPHLEENSDAVWDKVIETYDYYKFDPAFKIIPVDKGCVKFNRHIWKGYSKDNQRKLLNMECELRICDIYARSKGYCTRDYRTEFFR
jgi:hypothetical protein